MEKGMLSNCEALIMKAIWEAGKDISIPDLTTVLREKFGKDYKRTTVVTFLLRMSDKGYVHTYRAGRLSYAHALESQEDYKKELAQRETDFWFNGMASDYLASLSSGRELTDDDLSRIRSLLDGLDD